MSGPTRAPAEPRNPEAAESSPPRRFGTRTRRTLWILFVLWAGAGVLFLIESDRFPIGNGGRGDPAPAEPESVLVVADGGGGDPAAMFLLVHHEEGSTVVLLPTATVVEVPGQGSPQPLAVALEETGPDGLATAVANALGTRVPELLVGAPSDVVDLVEGLGGVEVDVPATVEIEEGDRIRTVFAAGRREMRGDAFLAYLTTEVPGQQEPDRVARQGVAWRALFATLADRDRPDAFASWASEADPARLGGIVLRAAGVRELTVLTLPVRRVGVSGADLYEIDPAGLGVIEESLAVVRTVDEREGRRIRLLVGADGPVGPAAARVLVEAGFTIVLTGPASEPYDQTRVVIAENTPDLRAVAAEITELLGAGRLGVYRRPQSVFDATVVIGRDWARAHGIPEP